MAEALGQDFVVLGDALTAIPNTIAQARRTLRAVRQNLAWAAGYNALCVPLAVAGWLPAPVGGRNPSPPPAVASTPNAVGTCRGTSLPPNHRRAV